MKLAVVAFACLAMFVQVAVAQPKGQAAYLDGLERLESAKWAEATAAFNRAIDEDEENAAYYLARGVSYVLAEDFKSAMTNFDRVLRLKPNDKHAKLWKSVTLNMQGRFMDGSAVYPQATRDQYENQVQDMARLYGQLNFTKQNGGSTPEWDKKWETDQATAKRKFPEIAKLFTSRVKGASGDLVPMIFDRASKKMAAGDYAAAMADLQQAAAANPNDLKVMQARGMCNLNLGSPAAARALFVRVLTANSANADAWYGHALACLALGDTVRAKASIENALSLNPPTAKAMREAFDKAAKASPPPSVARDQIAALPAELSRIAGSGASNDELLKQAVATIRATNAYRLRADETYLDRRLRLEAVARANPKSAEALADLGEYLYTQAVSIRGESVEPRAVFATYRPQTEQTQQQELALAEQTLGNALKINPKNVKALTFSAACAIYRRQWGDAEQLLRRALDVDSSYGPLLETFAKVMDHAAGVSASAASDLRTVKSWEDAYYYYYRRPSQAELQAANEYDQQAKAMWAIAEKHLEAAAKNYAGKPAGFYYTGVIAKRKGDATAAQAAFERCVAMAPDYAAAWDALTELYYRAGMKVEATGAKSAASNLEHTTAGHLLHLAWGQIVRTTYKTAGDTLAKAVSTDPADPRSYAYVAVIAQAKENKAAALAWWRCAAALEEAHAGDNGVNFRAASYELIDPWLAGRAMAINIRLGRLALELGQPDVAAAAFSANIEIGKRFAKMDRFTPLPSSQLPDQQPDETTIPEADSGLSLIAWSMLGLGEAYAKQGREADAVAQFNAVRQLPSQVPPTIDHRNRLADPCALATIALIKPLMASKNYQAAQDIYRAGGVAGAASKPIADELRALSKQIDAAMSGQRMDEADQQMREMMKKQQEEIDRIQRERQQQDQRRRNPPPR